MSGGKIREVFRYEFEGADGPRGWIALQIRGGVKIEDALEMCDIQIAIKRTELAERNRRRGEASIRTAELSNEVKE